LQQPVDRHLKKDLENQSDEDQWLCPLMTGPHGKRFLDINLDEYLELLDWTGRQIVEGKKGAIPPHLAPILFRLEVEKDQWRGAVTLAHLSTGWPVK